MQQNQVIIVGAGPAGLVSANLLGRAGIRVLFVERNEDISATPKALMVDDEFFRLLHKIGLGDALRAHGVGPVSYDYVSLLGFTVVHNEGHVTPNGFPSRTAIFQPEFERILMEGVRRFPSVKVRFGTEVTKLQQGVDKITVAIKSGPHESSITADYLIAADGSHSSCRKALGIPFEELVEIGQRHIVVDVSDDDDSSLTARICMGRRRVYTSLPSPNGGRRYEFSLRPDEDAEDMLSDAVVSKLVGRFAPYERLTVIRKAVYSFHSRLAKKLRDGRVFLVGDAAHVMPIFGSQGMNSGARDVHNLTWKLERVLKGESAPEILDTYHDERHSHVAETIRAASANIKLQANTLLPLALCRDILVKTMTALPAVRRYFAEMRYIPKPFLKAGIVVNPTERRDGSIVGRLLPAPEVRIAGGIKLLDDVIGPGWALVGCDVPRMAKHPADSFWSELGATWTSVASVPGAADVILQDNRLDEVFAAHKGEWLVVRPDRIVAASARPEHLATVGSQLRRLLASASAGEPSNRRRQYSNVSP